MGQSPQPGPPVSVPPGIAELREATARPPSATWVQVYVNSASVEGALFTYGRFDCTVRQMPYEDWMLATQLVCAVADSVQDHLACRGQPAAPEPASVIARTLAAFLTQRSGSLWGLHAFTGSVVSKLITDLTRLAETGGNPVLRGPSEHSLACGAMARWQLTRAPFLLVATAAMVDELRGTLANLRDARGKGFIVFGEPPADGWMPFQGVVHSREDARAVFAARGLTCFYLDDPERLSDDLRRAVEAYDTAEGPVVLLTTPRALRVTGGPLALPDPPRAAPRPSSSTLPDAKMAEAIEEFVHLVNNGPARVVWQCGDLDAEEHARVRDIAHRAGIALVDSLHRPGTVSAYHEGRRVPEYVGTLGLYGYSTGVWNLLHDEKGLRPRQDQSLCFLKSSVPDVATPFSERSLHERLHIVQVTERAEHIAPFTCLPMVAPLRDVLRHVRQHLDVDPGLLRQRQQVIERARRTPADLIAEIPSRPMSHGFFFAGLGALLHRMIQHEGYTYTGVYDVGRGGISAVRNLPRTGPGFSGWYGRALMGDALLAAPALALTTADSVVVFTGDGASALVPDPLPVLLQQILYEGARLRGNLTVFRLVNGGYSIIRTTRELYQHTVADAQMSLLSLTEPSADLEAGPVRLHRSRLLAPDPDRLRDALLERGRVNVFTVPLIHDSGGDAIGPYAARDWRLHPT
ncbi:hypothetical protein ACFVFQ_31140 [Streptomyces sp. NPDC057743]|uniref:hypothetical protein n=1 Tax=Streptomyces sp. NPDC057743 TaxID=3346236 RepID=UPI0036C163F9